MNDISQQIKDAVALAVKEQLDKVELLYGRDIYRRFEDLRLKLKKIFPNEEKLNNEKTAIGFVEEFVKDQIKIFPKFVDRRNKEKLTTYVIQGLGSQKAEMAPAQPPLRQPAAVVAVAKPEGDKLPELFKFAFFFNFNDVLQKIANLAKPEAWWFGDEANVSDDNRYPILKSYLFQVFSRLKYEKEVLKLDNKIVVGKKTGENGSSDCIQVCAFHTGLVSTNDRCIYLLFEENKRPGAQQKWFFKCVSDNTDNQIFLPFKIINKLPVAADFYKSLSHSTVIYEKEVAAINFDHCFDHCERLPMKFLRKYFGSYHKFSDNSEMPLKTPEDWDDFKKYIKDKANEYDYNEAYNKLKDCIERAKINARYSDSKVYIYRPEKKQVDFFLPLYLVKPQDDTDFEVGVIVDNSIGEYVARTIYHTSMAYAKIRLMGRQDRSWLKPTKIKNWKDPYYADVQNKNKQRLD